MGTVFLCGNAKRTYDQRIFFYSAVQNNIQLKQSMFSRLRNAIIFLAQTGQHAGTCMCQDEAAEMNLPQ